jgi:pectinesterase
VTEIISNGLFVNWGFLKHEKAYYTADYEFPSWFSRNERRLLESWRIRANLVVAKDGSGHFRSVQAAINAAARRRFKTRFVIHVKRGVYRENIEVDKTNDNIMLVGDGMRYTIITSGRSVQDGFTTYSSATAGITILFYFSLIFLILFETKHLRYMITKLRASLMIYG